MNGGRPTRRVARGYAPQPRARGYRGAPARPHGQPPRGLRPRATGIRRDHTDLTRHAGTGCRHTQGLEEVWSARHGTTVDPGAGLPSLALALTEALELSAAVRPGAAVSLGFAAPVGRSELRIGAVPSSARTPLRARCRLALTLLWQWVVKLVGGGVGSGQAQPQAGSTIAGSRLAGSPGAGGKGGVGSVRLSARGREQSEEAAMRLESELRRLIRLENQRASGGGSRPAVEPEPRDAM